MILSGNAHSLGSCHLKRVTNQSELTLNSVKILVNGHFACFCQVLGPGILVLGCVREVRDFDLVVSLPNGFQGTIPITDICESYTSLLQKLAEGNDIDLAEDRVRMHVKMEDIVIILV